MRESSEPKWWWWSTECGVAPIPFRSFPPISETTVTHHLHPACPVLTHYSVICLGEMCVFAPISGGYLHFTERWLHPAVGFALGWQSIYSSFISIPTEIIAASILISYWDAEFPISHQAAYLTAAIAFATFINFLGPRWFGETEFWCKCGAANWGWCSRSSRYDQDLSHRRPHHCGCGRELRRRSQPRAYWVPLLA